MASGQLASSRGPASIHRSGPSLKEALALGALQGPTELLPISSSGHTAIVPWLAGWRYGELEPGVRKAFEVALHAGAALALALAMRRELDESMRTLDARRVAVVALSLAPPVAAGCAFEQTIERRLGGPRSIAFGLLAGAGAMALADLAPSRPACAPRRASRVRVALGVRSARIAPRNIGVRVTPPARPVREARRERDATPADGLALGLAQSAALIPGVSRNGATLACARALGFGREDAQALSWHAALPVILGAVTLKAWRLARPGAARRDSWPALAAGMASAFFSTTVSARLLLRDGWRRRALWPYAAYRCTIAAIVLARARNPLGEPPDRSGTVTGW